MENSFEYEISLAEEKDIPGIKDIQSRHLGSALSPEDKKNDGFVSIDSSPELLKEIISEIGIIVAKYKDKVIGYLFPISESIVARTPILDKFAEDLDRHQYEGKNLSEYRYCFLGQVCIEKEFRGAGIFEDLYRGLISELKEKYDIGVSLICSDNPLSLHTHIDKLGIKVISEFYGEGKNWYTVVLDFRNTII